MATTISKALEQRLLRSAPFSERLRDLHRMTKLEVLYLNAFGEEKLRVPRRPGTPLRLLDHDLPFLAATRSRARQTALVGGEQNMPWKEVTQAIRVDQEVVGYLVLSAWRPADAGPEPLRRLWSQLARAGQDVRWPDLESTWMALPEANEEELAAWQRHLRLVADESIRQSEQSSSAQTLPEQLPALVRSACNHVRDSFRGVVTLEQVARHCGVSPEHLSRSFHQSTGLRFREYVAETRVEAVCSELRETADPIGDIAERNGFATLSRFNRTFRASTGMTPREWRKHQFRMQ